MRLRGIAGDWLLQKLLAGIGLYTLGRAAKSVASDDARTKGEMVFEQTMAYYREIASARGLDLNEVMTGSIKKKEGAHLYALLIQHEPVTVLEVGTFVGLSTLMIAQALKSGGRGKVYSVDPWMRHRGLSRPVELGLEAAAKVGVQDQIDFIQGWLSSGPHQPSNLHDDGIPIVDQGHSLVPHIAPLDFVYIDGDHSILNTVMDISIALAFLRSGGVCVVHDVYSTPTVRRAIAELLLDEPIRDNFRFEVLEGSDGLGIFHKIRETVAIRVQVQDKESKAPIAGVSVRVKGRPGAVDADEKGEIYLYAAPAGDYRFAAQAEGYESIEDRLFRVDGGRRLQKVVVEMDKIKGSADRSRHVA